MWFILLFIKIGLVQPTFALPSAAAPVKHRRTELALQLLKDYEKQALPHDPSEGPVNVSLSITINDFEFDMHRSSLNVHSWLTLSWVDPRLKWNSSLWSNISSIRLDPQQVWLPDIMLYNSADTGKVDYFGRTKVVIDSSGDILWVPPMQLEAMCEENLRLWPRDTQDCFLKIGSWTYHGLELNLMKRSTSQQTDLSSYSGDHRWKILSTKSVRNEVTYACCPEPYVDIKITLSIQRQAAGLRSLMLLSALAVMVLSLVIFCLPPASSERILISCFNIAVIILHLLYFAFTLPLRSSLPRIVHFYTCSLVLVLLSVVVSAVAGFFQRNFPQLTVPSWMSRFFSSGWTKFLCISSSPLLESSGNSRSLRLQEEGEQQYEDVPPPAMPILAIVDRVLSFVFVVLFIILLIAYV